MPRSSQQLHPHREPAPLRPAATVLLLRDSRTGIEVLMTRRSMTASFAPGAYVFPGGGIDAADAQAHAQSTRRATQSDLHLTQAIAAIRESFEELGVLLARHADGSHVNTADIAALDRKAPFAAQCRERGLTLAADEVFVLAHWITDRDLPRRFDVPFLVARMPEGQSAGGRRGRAVRAGLGAAGRCAGAAQGGRLFHHLPHHTHAGAAAAVTPTSTRCWRPARPKSRSGPPARAPGCWPARRRATWSTKSPYGELALTCPDGQIVHTLDWQHRSPWRCCAT
jgi:recombination protein RecT